MSMPTHEPRLPLSRESVTRAAINLIDRDGLGDLSMRRLGKHLGVEAMTLYRYVDNRDALLNLVVEHLVDEMSADPEVLAREGDHWQEYVRRVAHGVRRIALSHPNVFPLIASHPPEAPWIRPPLRSLHWIDAFIDALHDRGLKDEDAVRIYRSFTGFLLGALLLEVSSKGVEITGAAETDAAPAEINLSDYPALTRVAPLLKTSDSGLMFDASLDRHIRSLVEDAL